MDPFAAREIRVPVEEIDSEEEERKHHATRAVNLRHRVVPGRTSVSSPGRGRRCTSRRRWRRQRSSRRWATAYTGYLPVTGHSGILVRRNRNRRQRYHLDRAIVAHRKAIAASPGAGTRGALPASLKSFLYERGETLLFYRKNR